jgi:hypothetical protein
MPEREINREQLADLMHEIWCHWMQHLFAVTETQEDGSQLISLKQAARWARQVGTVYADLAEEEKESDRRQADKIIALLGGNSDK